MEQSLTIKDQRKYKTNKFFLVYSIPYFHESNSSKTCLLNNIRSFKKMKGQNKIKLKRNTKTEMKQNIEELEVQ